jgi:hypothetical protein
LPPASAPASPKDAPRTSARLAANASPTRSTIQATPTGWRRSHRSAGPNSSGSPTPAWGGEWAGSRLLGGGPRQGSGSSVRVFLDRRDLALESVISGVGFVWISLDSLVRIETYQWVMRENRGIFFSRRFCPWGQCGGINSRILCRICIVCRPQTGFARQREDHQLRRGTCWLYYRLFFLYQFIQSRCQPLPVSKDRIEQDHI